MENPNSIYHEKNGSLELDPNVSLIKIINIKEEKTNLFMNTKDNLTNSAIIKIFNSIWYYNQIIGEISIKNIDKYKIEENYLRQKELKDYFLKLIQNEGIYAKNIKENSAEIDLGYGRISLFSPDLISFIGNVYVFNGLNIKLETEILKNELELAGKLINISNNFLKKLYHNKKLGNLEERCIKLDDPIIKEGFERYRFHKFSEFKKNEALLNYDLHTQAICSFI